MAASSSSPSCRVLCLHGGSQTGEVFRSRIRAFEKKLVSELNASLTFADGPVLLPLTEGQTESRTWLPFDDSVRSFVDETFASDAFDLVIGFSAGAVAAAYLARTRSVKAAILAGPPRVDFADSDNHAHSTHVLLVVGENDECVEVASSRSAAAKWFGKQGYEEYAHDKGHSLPTRARDVEAYLAFLKNVAREALEEEIETLSAIYDEDFSYQDDGFFKVVLSRDVASRRPLTLVARLPPAYPVFGLPHFTVETLLSGLEFSTAASLAIRRCADNAVVVGEPSMFAAVSAVNELIGDETAFSLTSTGKGKVDQAASIESDEEEEEHEDDDEDVQQISEERIAEYRLSAMRALRRTSAVVEEEDEDDESRRRKKSGSAAAIFEMVIGVVGKPSAGKSTFFNATTRSTGSLAAKVAAYPFTTIDPNVKEGLFSGAELPEVALGLNETCPTRHGRDCLGRRLLPVLLKDVAGLVPGAYKGLGKGNRFLNDLLDASALIHVVDASTETDDCGQPIEATSSLALEHEISWVRLELHRWIVGNVAAKWRSVTRRAKHSKDAGLDRALSLFAGYHAPPSLTRRAVHAAGLDPAAVKDWKIPEDLHKLVAAFLLVRFPTVIALNKCDRPAAIRNVDEFMARRRSDHVSSSAAAAAAIPCSASTDAFLVKKRAQGEIEWVDGAPTFRLKKGLSENDAEVMRARTLLDHWRRENEDESLGFGTLAVVSEAARLANPTLVFPVADLDSLRGAISTKEAPLPDCLILRPDSTVDDAYHALRRLNAIDGDFVRADALCISPHSPPVRKTARRHDKIREENRILRIATNRKPRWQTLSSSHK